VATFVTAFAATNLLENATFDEGIAGWESSGGTLSWEPSPPPGTDGGAIRNTNALPYDYQSSAYAQQCQNLSVPAGDRLIAAVDVFAEPGQHRYVDAGIFVQGWSGPDCTLESVGGNSATTPETGAWTNTRRVITFTGAAQSVQTLLMTTKAAPGTGDVPTDPVTALFDNAHVGPLFTTYTPFLVATP
jgi:hypothetical protein